MAVEQKNARIVKTPDVLGGKPRIAGHRIGVRFIRENIEGRGLSPQTFADRHELSVADVYRALVYYHEHPDEMAQLEERRKKNNKQIDKIAFDPEDVDTDDQKSQ